MDRRSFLHAGAALGALALAPGARADEATCQRFHAALARDPSLAVYANQAGSQEGDAVVKGRLPRDLRGTFYRNGPGRFELGGERYHHWFDGDGFAQAWTVADGKARHRGRFVETQRYRDESAAGRFLYPAFGTLVTRRGVRDNDTMNAANTNLLPYDGRLYALWEGGSATELDPESLATRGIKTWSIDLRAMPFSAHPKLDQQGGMWNFGTLPGANRLAIYQIGARGQVLRLYALWEGGSATELDPESLATRGIKTWSIDLRAMPFSAHPKLDQQGGMWNFGTLPGANRLAIYQIGARGQVLRTAVLPVPQLAMVHDFVVSSKHLVFIVPPYDLQNDAGLSFADRHRWAGSGNSARAARVIVIAKDTLALRQVFELPPQMVFHFGNAWEDGDCTRFDVVLHEGDALAEVGSVMKGEHTPPRSRTVQVTLDYASGRARTERLFGTSEFPRVMPQVAMARHRRLALLGASGASPGLRLDSVNLVDTDSGKVDAYVFGAGWQVEEHVLVPRRNARSELDGYLVGVAQDLRAGVTVMTVFDAAGVKDGPVALARLPYRAPHCFHGNFLTA